MRVIVRYFFRTLRLILTPFILLSEKLNTPKSLSRTAEEQALADEASKNLALYQFSACPFCMKIRKEIARLGLNIETRNAQHYPQYRAALEAGGGSIKVPCLKVQRDDGSERWL
ncbi:glutaredoxin [Marinobacter sediminum]|uniref:glutaredoxin family protein n=1 Tax=Marinobacter sediminum TaxID=256323 RepID=UPI00202E30C7|nr:glutaredoxin [Marinobacter sediminum]MCM0611945.1 glutaredoxin [Marinobacter sediminum]